MKCSSLAVASDRHLRPCVSDSGAPVPSQARAPQVDDKKAQAETLLTSEAGPHDKRCCRIEVALLVEAIRRGVYDL